MSYHASSKRTAWQGPVQSEPHARGWDLSVQMGRPTGWDWGRADMEMPSINREVVRVW